MYGLVPVEEVGKLQPGTHITVQSLLEKLDPSLKALYPLVSVHTDISYTQIYRNICELSFIYVCLRMS